MKPIQTASALIAALLMTACAGTTGYGPRAEAVLEARSGSKVSGKVAFSMAGDKLRIDIKASGLTPGAHGFHVHDSGDCSAADASSAKGHFNPTSKAHGHHEGGDRHAGDMPNLVADAAGNASFSGEIAMLSLGTDASSVLNRSVVIHADPDDYKSQPAGNSGKRIACGTIKAVSAPSNTY